MPLIGSFFALVLLHSLRYAPQSHIKIIEIIYHHYVKEKMSDEVRKMGRFMAVKRECRSLNSAALFV